MLFLVLHVCSFAYLVFPARVLVVDWMLFVVLVVLCCFVHSLRVVFCFVVFDGSSVFWLRCDLVFGIYWCLLWYLFVVDCVALWVGCSDLRYFDSLVIWLLEGVWFIWCLLFSLFAGFCSFCIYCYVYSCYLFFVVCFVCYWFEYLFGSLLLMFVL